MIEKRINDINFEEMWTFYNMGLHETGYIIYGERFLSIEATLTLNTVILPVIRRLMPILIANDQAGWIN